MTLAGDPISGPLAIVDRRLREEFDRSRAQGKDPADSFRGLYIDEAEVSAMLERPPSSGSSELALPRLEALGQRLGLDKVSMQLLLACLAPDLNPDYERVYAFLQDDIARKRPGLALLERLFGSLAGGPAEVRARLHPSAPLLRAGLLSLPESGDARASGEMAPRADERVIGYLQGSDLIDRRVAAWAQSEETPLLGPLPRAAYDLVTAAAAAAAGLVVFIGPPFSGKKDAARAFAQTLGRPLLVVDVPDLLQSPLRPAEAIRLTFREANLLSAVLYLAGADRLWEGGDDRAAVARRSMESELQACSFPCLLGGAPSWEPPPTLAGRPMVRVAIPLPTLQERETAWLALLSTSEIDDDEVRAACPPLAASFRLSVTQIGSAYAVAVSEAALEPDQRLKPRHLYAGARALSSRDLSALGDEIVLRATWQHLVLPDESIAQLRELCMTVRHHDEVLESAGFGRRLSGGTGITALFTGVSGTGKTMAAEVIAAELGVPLFRIDLASIVSKWIGETEKNLDRVFEAAADSNAILFFDEADAVFGKRSEVKDSHDRYANLEISYLLQRMEAYEGVAILATNMRHQLDDAFLRRLTFAITFPLPDESGRQRIWEAIWPQELERGADVELARIAKITLSGGNIKNVLLSAAHLATADHRPVGMADLIHGVRREYQKIGKQMAAQEVDELLG
jgi:AAA+ superfamily predicted ATPase